MKDYVIRQYIDKTIVINIKEAEEIYEFSDVSKIIIDNINNKNLTLKLLKNKYKNISKDIIENDYNNFINQLNDLKITPNNIEKKIISNNIYSIKNATIEIINTCPFKCDHCFVSNKKEILNLENFQNLINQLIKLDYNEILITGGEPFLHNSFVDIYLSAKKNGFLVTINTNGYLLNEMLLNLFIEYKPRNIELSIYGYDNKSYYNFTHTKRAFNIINNNIDKLIDYSINLNLKTVLTKKKKNYLYKLKSYAKEKNLPFRYDYIIFPNQDNICQNMQRCTPDEIIKVLKEDNDSTTFFKEKIKNINIKNTIDNHVFQCSINSGRIYISSNLDIRPCLVVPFKYNLKEISIEDACNKFEKIPEKYIYRSDNKCMNCNKKSLCRYCPGKFYMETGSLTNVPNFYCELADKLIKEFK